MRAVYELNGKPVDKEVGKALALEAGLRLAQRREDRRAARRPRLSDAPERASVAKAMDAVEEQIVKAMWTIARQPLGKVAPIDPKRCGLEYMPDDILSTYADAAGGKWDSVAPRPALPSSRDISIADRVQDWLLLIEDEAMRKLLVVGASSKRGDVNRRIPWIRIRSALGVMHDMPQRTLQWRYRETLRIIVNELTIARLALQC